MFDKLITSDWKSDETLLLVFDVQLTSLGARYPRVP